MSEETERIMERVRKALELQEQIERLVGKVVIAVGGNVEVGEVVSEEEALAKKKRGRPKGRMSAEGRAAISKAMKERWMQRKHVKEFMKAEEERLAVE